MASQIITNPIKRGTAGTHVAMASDIAYTLKTVQSGPIGIEMIDVSLDDQIKSMIQTYQDIQNLIGEIEENTTIQAELKSLSDRLLELQNNSSGLSPENQAKIEQIIAQINTINDSVLSAQAAATKAENHETEVIKQVNSLSQLSDSINQGISKIDGLTEIANDLKSSFDADARMQILSQEAYDKLTSKEANTMYFIYENN